MKRSIVSLVAGLILTTACSAQPSETASYEDPNAVTTASGMVIEGAWMRTPPGGRDITAGYVFVRGASEQDDRLIAAHSDQVERIELHTVISEGGIMQMRPVEGYDIPAGETLELAPRGNHLMVFGLSQAAQDAQQIDVILSFEQAGDQVVRFVIQTMAPGVTHAHDGEGEHHHGAGEDRAHDHH